jgi:MEMO1 family protein
MQAGDKTMQPRKPAVAGQFYSADNHTCIKDIKMCLEDRNLPKQLPETIVAGIVPHAGWTFSGDVAANGSARIKEFCWPIRTATR